MKISSMIVSLLVVMLVACGGADPMVEINKLVEKGQVPKAKVLYQEWVDREQDPNLERKFIKFCFEHEQYGDFRRQSQSYLSRYPDDKEVKNMTFEYYAKLARDAERQKLYGTALEYIVTHLLDPDYAESSRWEKRQSEILRKWYEQQEDKDGQKKILNHMRNHGFENLAKTIDPELYSELDAEAGKPE